MADTDTIVVIGGGIAGVSCTETLSTLCKNESITLVTASPLIKAVTNFKQISRRLEEFDVVENPSSELQEEHRNVTVLQAKVVSIDPLKREIVTSTGESVPYTKLCICTGGSPKLIMKDDPNVIGIRDTESVSQFQAKLGGSRRVIIVGNGGIATELAYEIEDCEVVWAIKDKSISSAFVDAGTAQFFLPHLSGDKKVQEGPMKRVKYTVKPSPASSSESGAKGGALGPDWSLGIPMNGQVQRSRHVRVEYECEIKKIISLAEIRRKNLTVDKIGDIEDENTDWPVYALLTNDKLYGCDFIVSATGVVPNGNELVTQDLDLKLAADGGVIVNNCMKTNIDHIYAAGDVCSASWDWAPHWLQMRLWSQARQMGCYAAQCIKADLNDKAISLDFCFELFAHVTKFFGYKVILLGKFNGQGLDDEYEILLRMTKGVEYIKVILKDGRMQGAILIGETDLEETFENLILNQLDLSRYGEDLLDPGIDIDDYFD